MTVRDVPAGLEPALHDFLRELKERVENMNAADLVGLGEAVAGVGGTGGTGGDATGEDFSTPPAVDDLDIFIANTYIGLTWTPPAGSAHISYTEIWRGTTNVLANATFVGASPHPFFYDDVGRGSPLYYYWARHVRSNVNTPVFGPWEGPVSGQTPVELDALLDLLEGEISELQLVTSLNDRIDLIDVSGGPTGTGLIDSITQEITDRSDGDSALAAQIESIVVTAGNQVFVQDSAPTDPPETLNEGDRWIDSDDGNKPYVWHSGAWVDVTDARLTSALASITSIEAAIVDLDGTKAEAADVTVLEARVTVTEGDITTLDGQIATANIAIADLNTNKVSVSTFNTLSATVTSQGSSITTLSGQMSTVNTAVADLNANKASVSSVTTLAATVTAQGSSLTSLSAVVVTQTTAIADLNANKASVASVTTLQTTVNGHTASIQTNIASIQGLSAEYSVRIDAGGRVVGFGLYGGPTSSAFIVKADEFVVALPGQSDTPVFAVGTIGGTPHIILNAATVVGDLSITNAMVDTLSATKLFVINGTIADAIIGTAHITNAMVSNTLQSDNWNAVTKTGWRLTKDLALFEGRGITIYDNAGNPIFGTGTGFNLNWTAINGSGKPADNATVGATWGVNVIGAPIVQEAFETITKWSIISGNGAAVAVIDTTGSFGGKAIEILGNGFWEMQEDIPYDPAATYRVRARGRDMSATGLTLFIGFQALDANKARIGLNGAAGIAPNWFVANGVDPGGSYTEYFGFMRGFAAGTAIPGDSTLANPGNMHANVRYVRPIIRANFNEGSPVHLMRVDSFIVDKVQEQITPTNATTYIKALAVDSLQIAGDAVTVEGYSERVSDLVVGPSNVVAAQLTFVVPDVGSTCRIRVIWALRMNGQVSNPTTVSIRLRRATGAGPNNPVWSMPTVFVIQHFWSGVFAEIVVPGTHVYQLELSSTSGGTTVFAGSSMSATLVKK